MTREEAIRLIGWLKCTTNREDDLEAIDMAIEALQFADKSPRTVKLTKDIEITLDEEAYEIGYTHGQMADRPQGEWKTTVTGQPYCSNCEYVFGEDEEFSPFWKFCPMCGARMENKE